MVFSFLFFFICAEKKKIYKSQKKKKGKVTKKPKFNDPRVDDPCVEHETKNGSYFKATRDIRSKFKSNEEQNGLRTFTEVPYYLQVKKKKKNQKFKKLKINCIKKIKQKGVK